jgi:RHS repeat-associated protein
LPNATSATYDRNRLTNFNGAAWTYDDQGNLTGDGTNTYVWDARNRLKEIKAGATTVAAFAYDALDRRTTRTVSGNATGYLHDGLTPAQEIRGASSTQLLAGPGIDDYLGRIEPTRTRYYVTDMLGSTAALADATGAKVTSYTYEPYGETTVAGEGSDNPFQYTGRENDQTGLFYYRARYYHPVAKRFVSEDPIGQEGGLHPYLYVEANPITDIDPTGLSSIVFDRQGGRIDIFDAAGRFRFSCRAGNNVTPWANGPFPTGTYPFSHYNPHPQSGPTDAFGSHGIFIFKVPNRTGMGLHSGRRGPESPTLGCVRTEDACMLDLKTLHKHDPVKSITVQ